MRLLQLAATFAAFGLIGVGYVALNAQYPSADRSRSSQQERPSSGPLKADSNKTASASSRHVRTSSDERWRQFEFASNYRAAIPHVESHLQQLKFSDSNGADTLRTRVDLGKLYVDSSELAKAEAQLRSVLDDCRDGGVDADAKSTLCVEARIQLARVHLYRKETNTAFGELNAAKQALEMLPHEQVLSISLLRQFTEYFRVVRDFDQSINSAK